jgi:hypothetical protein
MGGSGEGCSAHIVIRYMRRTQSNQIGAMSPSFFSS